MYKWTNSTQGLHWQNDFSKQHWSYKKKVQRSPQCVNTAPYVPSCYWKPSPWSQIIYAQNNEHKPENNFLLTSENTAAFTLVEDFKIQVKGNYHWVNHTKNMIIPEKKWTQLLIIQLEKEVLQYLSYCISFL